MNKAVFFLDLFMPIMDGWQFLGEFSKLPLYKKPILFLLTSSAYGKDEVKAKNHSEVRAFLHKPITHEMLADLALKYWGD